jgi:hypothetical protein
MIYVDVMKLGNAPEGDGRRYAGRDKAGPTGPAALQPWSGAVAGQVKNARQLMWLVMWMLQVCRCG